MALNTDKDLKLYWSIREVANMFGITESNLRFWEKHFPTLKPKKVRQTRQYTREDIEEVRTIYNLCKERGVRLATAKEMMKVNRKGVLDKAGAIAMLQNIREELVSIDKELKEL